MRDSMASRLEGSMPFRVRVKGTSGISVSRKQEACLTSLDSRRAFFRGEESLSIKIRAMTDRASVSMEFSMVVVSQPKEAMVLEASSGEEMGKWRVL